MSTLERLALLGVGKPRGGQGQSAQVLFAAGA